MIKCCSESLSVVFSCKRWDLAVDECHRIVDQYPRRTAVGVAMNLAADGIVCVLIDAGNL